MIDKVVRKLKVAMQRDPLLDPCPEHRSVRVTARYAKERPVPAKEWRLRPTPFAAHA